MSNEHLLPSTWVRNFLMREEGFRPTAYKDIGGVWTIGYGHTRGVGPGMTCTLDQGQAFLAEDTMHAAEDVRRIVTVSLTQPQFDALVAFVFNVGAAALAHTKTLAKLNAGDYKGFADALLLWDHDNGQVVVGLLLRRQEERARFLGGVE